jgi:hypothetical protein
MAFKGKSFGDPRVRVRSDGTVSASPEMDDRLRARVAKSSAYEKYKEQLHAFFDGDKPLPENLRQMLETRPGAEEHIEVEAEAPARAESAPKKAPRGPASEAPGKRRRRRVQSSGDNLGSLLDAVRKAKSPREVEAAVDALRGAGHALPEDGEILSKALGHSDEAIIAEALEGLLKVEDDDLPNPRLLRTRIENVALLASSSEVRDLCGELKTRLG